ncbi:electron transport complex subunit RsxC [Candidatus Omnitrophota bacterium]
MFKRRLAPRHYKQATQGAAIEEMPPAAEVVLPLLQHTGAVLEAKVCVGEQVRTGQLIADSQAYLSSPLHASVSGHIKAIEARAHPVLGQHQAIVITSDAQDSKDRAITDRDNVDTLTAPEIRNIVRSCGVVGLGGAAFPTHVKLTPPKNKPIDAFILNGAECEPFLTADHRLMLEKPYEILAGMKVTMRALGVTRGFVAIEDNKPEAIKLFEKLVDGTEIKVAALESFYPQGAEKQMIKAILGREVPSGKLPFDVGVVVNNVATCFAIYEAIYQNKPLYERVITVSGKIVQRPANVKVRLGTSAREIIEFCGGLSDEPAKVIFGGPMMGIAQYTLDVPIIKGTSGILVFDQKESKENPAHPCIRCAKCLQACPMGLDPSRLAQAIEKGRFDLAREYHVLDCIECGICSYACPGNRNIVALVKLAKQRLKTTKK